MKITAHCLVKNEENFVWYAINSVIDYVDEILVWDQGSTDKTIQIVKSINNPKIKFKQITGDVSAVRQKMLDETQSDWVLILDGDEIWYEDAIKELVTKLSKKKNKKDIVVVPYYMLIGDMYHFQEKEAGKYKIHHKVGHYNVRLFKRNIKGLHLEGIYPNEAYVSNNRVKIQDFPKEKILFYNSPYLHASFLKRSSVYLKKVKYEIGNKIPNDFYYPEVFFTIKQRINYTVWEPISPQYILKGVIETPIKKIYRRSFWVLRK